MHTAIAYNMPALSLRCTYLTILAILVAAFVTFYPYLDGTGFCDDGGCPEISQPSSATSAGFSAACCPLAVLAVGAAAFAFVPFRGQRPVTDHLRLVSLSLTPDPPPPRSL